MSASDSHRHETTHDGTYCIYCGEFMSETLEPSDSHRAEVREAVSIAIDYAVQGTREYTAKALEDYYENRTKWVQSQTDAIMALLDAERERWIGEVKASLSNLYNPEITDLELNEYHNEDKPVVYVDAVSKVLYDTSHAG